MFQPSQYQQDIFDWHDKNAKSFGGKKRKALMVQAVAGSGKTTTIVQAANDHISPDMNAAVIAFNADIAKVLKERLPNRDCRTMHSLGLWAIRKQFKGIDVKPEKDDMILETLLDKYTYRNLYYPISKLASAVRNNLADTSDQSLQDLATDYNIDLNGETNLMFDTTRKLLDEDKRMTSIISFDDMIWLPVELRLNIPQFDYLAVDELQDLNKCQAELIASAVSPTGTIVGIGDYRQSIYKFRGADTESMPKFRQRFDAEILPLSISYRCPRAVVQLINQQFPDIEFIARDNAPEGSVEFKQFDTIDFQPGDMALCRVNAPLVNPCYSLIRRGVKAIIKGRDIGKGLISLIKKMRARDIPDLMDRLEDYLSQETYKLLAQKKEYQAQALTDRVETIYAIISMVRLEGSIEDVNNAINQIFSDGTAAVTFSSIHKAKGLEADNVYILKPELLPHPRAKTPDEQAQESNLQYVAFSRPKQSLVFVSGA
jgi:DNA helicase II / ATP-dependent DNA helicase PcrA